MRLVLPTLFVLALMTLAAMPPAAATHGETAYLVSKDPTKPFYAESYYVGGPGYLEQYWDFAILSATLSVLDYCPAVLGGWDPDPRPPPIGNPGPAGFAGTCQSGAAITTTGIDHFHNYPYPQGIDIHEISVTYADQTFPVQVVICDTLPRLRPILGTCDQYGLVLNHLV